MCITDPLNALRKVVFNGNNSDTIITLNVHNDFRNKSVVYNNDFLVSAIISRK